MAKFFRYHVCAIFAILLSTSVLVKSLPTSVLVDTKQQQQQSESSSAAINKGKVHILFSYFITIKLISIFEVHTILEDIYQISFGKTIPIKIRFNINEHILTLKKVNLHPTKKRN